MSILFNELSRTIDSDIKGLFENTLEFFSSEPLIDWLTEQSEKGLLIIVETLEKVAKHRILISKKEKEDITFDEIAKLKNELKAFYSNPKIPHHLKILSKFDLPSMRDAYKTINALLTRRFFQQDTEGNYYTPSNEELKKAQKERISKRQERKKPAKRSEEERKKVKATDFEKLKGDLLRQTREEPIRNSHVFNFVEPIPGCRYDIGESHGYVLIPYPEQDDTRSNSEMFRDSTIPDPSQEGILPEEIFLDDVHEYTYKISEQLFDNLKGKIDIQITTIEKWIKLLPGSEVEKVDYIHNTNFFGINARNNIFPICDSIVETLQKQFNMHKQGSHNQFLKGLVIKLQYRGNDVLRAHCS